MRLSSFRGIDEMCDRPIEKATSAVVHLIPVCSECGTTHPEPSADVVWNDTLHGWEIIDVFDMAWCSKCEATRDWHYAEIHDITAEK
jgi:hypothetical protein